MNTSRVASVSTTRNDSRNSRMRGSSLRIALRTAVEVTALLVIATLLVVGALTTGPGPDAAVETTRVRAEAGDSLWAIAREHPVAGQTTAETVELIVRLNGLQSPRVLAGGALAVPDVDANLQVASK